VPPSDDVPLRGSVLLSADHDTSHLDCGKPLLNEFLRRFALENQKGGKSRTYVATRGASVVAFYSLAPGAVAPPQVPPRVARGQGAQDIPIILLARLAVDKEEQGRGLGARMLLDALRRALVGAEAIGGRAVLVHALDEHARRFYQRYGFEPSPTDELHLLLLMKDIRLTVGS
jgi:GNAT superfamily N-acetyltransferase